MKHSRVKAFIEITTDAEQRRLFHRPLEMRNRVFQLPLLEELFAGLRLRRSIDSHRTLGMSAKIRVA